MPTSMINKGSGLLNNLTERFELILVALDAGIWEWNIKTNEEWWSDRVYTQLGYEPNAFASTFEYWAEHIVHPDDLSKVKDAHKAHFIDRKPYRVEVRQRMANGTYRWFETHGSASFDQDGNPLFMAGIIFDIHERKQASVEKDRYEFMLEEMSAMANIGGWEMFFENNHAYWTSQIYKIYGKEIGSAILPVEDMQVFPEPHRSKLSTANENMLKTGVPFDIDLPMKDYDGHEKWVRSLGKPVYDKQNQIIGARGVFQDITATKKLELELSETVQLLSDQNKRLQSFANIISHNLRSHVGNMQMLISLLAPGHDQDEQAEIINMLDESARKLSDTLLSLNEVVKVQNSVNLERTEISFKQLYEDTIAVLAPKINEAQVQLKADFKQKPTMLYVKVYAESMLYNLVSNAVKYHDPAKVKRWVEVKSFKTDDGRTAFTVADNGLGFDMNKAQQIFGLYKTFHDHEDSRGLGLYMTRHQIESLGGTISVHSEAGIGTTFTVIL